ARGPQFDRIDDDAWNTFTTREFTVSSQSNRLGIRLDGPSIPPNGGADIISEGIVTGAIQITGEGQPIVMLPSRATIGGYPKIATVVFADLDRLGQLRPGDRIRFEEVGYAGDTVIPRNCSDWEHG
ncbi:MAG: biotin-dependent carboxyltransferase family protein, partial [Thermomicrobiales bacterium]